MLERIIDKANLPDSEVTLAVMSGEYELFCSYLNKQGIKVIKTEQCQSLQKAEAYHADMQLLHIQNDTIIISEKNYNLKKQLENANIKFKAINKMPEPEYPKNIIFNVCIFNKIALLNNKFADNYIIEELVNKGFKIINVNQGYAKCSVAVIADNAVITADSGIYKALLKTDTDVLKIEPGFINLKGHNYGFIGGCCGKISKNDILFAGDLSSHPNCNDIITFCENHKVKVNYIKNFELTDIGGILPIKEKFE